jgi:hypothetical protein
MQASDFILKAGQRVKTRNGVWWLVMGTSRRESYAPAGVVLVCRPCTDDCGYMPGLMQAKHNDEYDVVEVYDEPSYLAWLTDLYKMGSLLWREESKEVRIARALVTRAEADLAAAQANLAEALAA